MQMAHWHLIRNFSADSVGSGLRCDDAIRRGDAIEGDCVICDEFLNINSFLRFNSRTRFVGEFNAQMKVMLATLTKEVRKLRSS